MSTNTQGAIFATTLRDLNGTGFDGTVFFAQGENSIGAQIGATGLTPGQVHVQHIHGRVDDDGNPLNSISPTAEQDADGDGFIELAEGAPVYGPILVPLSSPPGGELSAFPTAPNGVIDFSETFDLDDPATFNGDFDRSNLGDDLTLREVVVHGAELQDGDGANGGEADGTAGYKVVLPVGVGEITQATEVYTAELSTLNGPEVDASVTLLRTGDQLTVRVEANGFEPNQTHIQHIHGLFDADGNPADSMTPTLDDDSDGDGFLELAEGGPVYGPIVLSLSSPPGGALEDFPTAPDGTISYEQTFDLSDDSIFAGEFTAEDLADLSMREIVIHGLSLNEGDGGNGGEADGTAGFKLVLPVAAGEIEFQGFIAADETLLPLTAEGTPVADDVMTGVDANRLALLNDTNADTDPMVTANAYTNSVGGATSTQQFVLDHGLNTLGTLANNAGTLSTVAAVTLDGETLDFDAHAGFDIFSIQEGDNTAYALLNTDAGTGFYQLDLGTGAATLIGTIEGFDDVTGLAVGDPLGTGPIGYALANDGTTLLRFDVTDPSSLSSVTLDGPVTSLDAIDFRPATGELFGYDDTTESYVTVDPGTGAVTAASGDMVTPTDTDNLDIDWNPTIDRMRTVTETDQNIVYNPETGAASDAATMPLFYDNGDATVTFESEIAAFQNSLGVYLIGEDGEIGPGAVAFSSIEQAEGLDGPLSGVRPGGGNVAAGDNVALSDLFDSASLANADSFGFLLFQNGVDAGAGDTFTVQTVDGADASVMSDPSDLMFVGADGAALSPNGAVFNSLAGLNPDGEERVISGVDPVSGNLRLGFEDLDDFDFNDLTIAVDNGTGGQRVLTADEAAMLLPSDPMMAADADAAATAMG